MSENNLKPSQVSKTTPLDRLHKTLEKDMVETNNLIVQRLQSQVPVIGKVAHYIIAAGGKRIRPLLTLASARMFKTSDMSKAHLLAASVEFIHTATLLHDDVVDDSEQRRGQESSHIIFFFF